MPRVLFITYTHNVWGGIEKWFQGLTLWLQDKGWEIYVGLAKGARFNNPDIFLKTHNYIRNPLIMDGSVGTEEARISAIVKTCVSCDPDIIFSVGIGSVFPAVERLKMMNKKVKLVIPVHSLNLQYLQNIIDYFNVIDHVAGISRLIERFLLRNLQGEESRIHYIKNRAAPRKVEKKALSGSLKLAFVGRLEDSTKHIFDLALLCQKLFKSNAALEVHIFGSGPDEAELRHRLKNYVDAGKVCFHGYVSIDRLYDYVYPAIDVLVMFSNDGEGSPFVLPEGMHHGVVPVVSRFLGHAAEGLIRPGKNSLTFPAGDMDSAADHVFNFCTLPR